MTTGVSRRAALACCVLFGAALTAQSTASIALRSPAFKDGAPIPLAYTGYGDFKSPPLTWSALPKGTRELALIVDDPDVPIEKFAVHWLLYNIPATVTRIPEAAPPPARGNRPPPVTGAAQGPNALKQLGYLPPRPFAGSGVHHYTFTLYALDADLPLDDGLTRDRLMAAMKGHVIGIGRLVGVFERQEP
jgi:Raf kinase inhibitor-like YbhB/YbcL family protein